MPGFGFREFHVDGHRDLAVEELQEGADFREEAVQVIRFGFKIPRSRTAESEALSSHRGWNTDGVECMALVFQTFFYVGASSSGNAQVQGAIAQHQMGLGVGL